MNVKSTSMICRLLLFLGCGCIVRLSECIKVSAVYGESDVEFTCVISPYAGSQRWYIDSAIVASCGAVSCSVQSTNQQYSFTPNISSGIFIFKINSINSSDDKTIVGCFNGTYTEPLAINFPVNKPIVSDDKNDTKWWLILCICLGSLLFILVVSIPIRHVRERPEITKIVLKDKQIHLEWTDSLHRFQFIFGYIVLYWKQEQVKDERQHTAKRYCTLKNLDPTTIYEISVSRKLWFFEISAPKRSVITRKNAMLNDQFHLAKSTSIEVRWTKPDCISSTNLEYEVIRNGIKKEKRNDKTSHEINNLKTYETCKIEVFAVYNKTNSLLFAEEISATHMKMYVEDVCYEPNNTSVKCTIQWTVFDKPGPINESDKLLFNVICRSEDEQVHEGEPITDPSSTIKDLYPDRSYTVYVYMVYNSMRLEPPNIIELTPYKPTDLEHTEKSTVINVKWTEPEHTDRQRLQYVVTCDEVEVEKTFKKTCNVTGLVPGKTYEIKIMTIIASMESQPLVENITTPPLKVCLEDVCYEPGENCVKCNISWTVGDFDKPEPFHESDEFIYNVICFSGEKQVHKKEEIIDSSYTLPDLNPDCSYTVYVYAIYHLNTLEPPGEIKLVPYKPSNLTHTVKSTVIDVDWSRPDFTGNQELQYLVTCNEVEVEKTFNETCKITGLVPGKTYQIKIFTIIDSMKSQPLVEKITTPPLKVCLEDVVYEPGKKCLKSNISWAVRDFDKPEPFNKTDEFLYTFICCSGEEQVHKMEEITYSSYTLTDLNPDRSYTVYVYAIYHLKTLEPPGEIKLVPCKPSNLKHTEKSTVISVNWSRPEYTGSQNLQYLVTCDEVEVEKTFKTACEITGLVPGKTYKIKIFTLINSLTSQPLVEKITTKPVKVCLGDVVYGPGENCIKCNISWTVEDFDKPERFNDTDKFLYNVICNSGGKQVHKKKEITDSIYTIPDLYPDRSYTVYVYAIYHLNTLEPPGEITLASCSPSNLKQKETKSTVIDVEWSGPEYSDWKKLQYIVTCDEVEVEKTFKKTCKITGLVPGKTYKIKIFTLINSMKSQPLEEDITTKPLKVLLEGVCYRPGENCAECEIRWEVENFDKPEPFNEFETDKFHYNVICCSENKQEGKTTDSIYTLPDLYPERSYTVYVYAIYKSKKLEPPGEIKLAPYKPRNLKRKETKSTVIYVEWSRPEYTDRQKLQYLVRCNEVEVEKTFKKTCKITGLVPGKTYEIKIFTLINSMKSQPLVEDITTPPCKPTSLEVTEGSTQIKLKWKKPVYAGNQQLEYEVTCNQKRVTISPEASCKIENLHPGKKYDIEIFTVIKGINGLKSPPLQGTIRTKPCKPTSLKVTAGSTHIELNWEKPVYAGNQQLECSTQQLEYEVTCNQKRVTKTHETSCKIENLYPGQQYDIEIFTVIEGINGLKSPSLQRTIRTKLSQLKSSQPNKKVQQSTFPEIQTGNIHLVSEKRF